MSMQLGRSGYQLLVDGDLAWLDQQPRTLERDHIRIVLEASVDLLYPGEGSEVSRLRARVAELETEVDRLRARIAALEAGQ